MILWPIRIAAILYAYALTRLLRGLPARQWWTAACVFYLLHVVAAFQFVYGWSHTAAVAETARQTEALFGLYWGGGVWFNYLFTALWVGDVLWWRLAVKSRATRPLWMDIWLHGYMAWMFFNGAIVFPRNAAIRWTASAIALALLLLAASTRDNCLWRKSKSTDYGRI